jgi:endonuclease III
MKEGTRYAGIFKKAYTKLKQSIEAPPVPEPDDPVHRLAVAILGLSAGESAAKKALDRAFSIVLDWNELRVSNADEVCRAMGDSIDRANCERLIRALRSIYARENRVSLDRIKALGRREARQYLESLDGVDDYAAASVVLWSLGGHAIPVDDKLMAALRTGELVHPEASRAEIQAFLERHISANDAKQTCLIL